MSSKKLWLLGTAALLLVVPDAGAQQSTEKPARPREPLLTLKHFGGEGGKVLAAARDVKSFPLFEQPGGAKVAGNVSLVKDRELEYDDVRMLIYSFGEAECKPGKTEQEVTPTFLQDGHFMVNAGSEKITLAVGERLELVAYLAEGYHVARLRGRYVQIYGEDLKILRWEDAETWVRFRDIGGRSGWANVDSKDLKIARIEF